MNNSPSYIMNKKLLALEISGAVFGEQAVAVELYNEDGTTFSVAVGDLNSDDRLGSDDTGVESVSSRSNFGTTHELDNGSQPTLKVNGLKTYLTALKVFTLLVYTQ